MTKRPLVWAGYPRTEYNEQLWTTKDIAENGAADMVTEYSYDSDGRLVTCRA